MGSLALIVPAIFFFANQFFLHMFTHVFSLSFFLICLLTFWTLCRVFLNEQMKEEIETVCVYLKYLYLYLGVPRGPRGNSEGGPRGPREILKGAPGAIN